MRALLWVFKRTCEAAEEEIAGAKQAITQELSELYMRLETGAITETEFEEREAELLDRLDTLAENESEASEGAVGDEDDASDDEGESEADSDEDDADEEDEEDEGDEDEDDTDDEGGKEEIDQDEEIDDHG
jgi:hypothetical protein